MLRRCASPTLLLMLFVVILGSSVAPLRNIDAASPSLRDVLDRVGVLEEQVVLLQGEVADLKGQVGELQSGGGVGSQTYTVAYQEVGMRTLLLSIPGKLALYGTCQIGGPVLRIDRLSSTFDPMPLWYNEPDVIISNATAGFVQPAVAFDPQWIFNPNVNNSVLFLQTHVRTGTNEIAVISVGGIPSTQTSSGSCGFSAQVTISQSH